MQGTHGTVGGLNSMLLGQGGGGGTAKWKSNATKHSAKNLNTQFGIYPQRSVTHIKD